MQELYGLSYGHTEIIFGMKTQSQKGGEAGANRLFLSALNVLRSTLRGRYSTRRRIFRYARPTLYTVYASVLARGDMQLLELGKIDLGNFADILS